MMNNSICVVAGRQGIRDQTKPLYDIVFLARQLDVPTSHSYIVQDLPARISALLEQARGHQITDDGLDVSVIVFPVNMSRGPVLMTLPLSSPSKIGAKPMLCRKDGDKQSLLATIIGDEHDLSEKVFASIASFDRQRVLCLVPEDHPQEREILSTLQIESVKMDKSGAMQKIFFRTKIFGGDGSYSRSQCGISIPMFRLWFPNHTCSDLSGLCRAFYQKKPSPAQKKPSPAPKKVQKKNMVPPPVGVRKHSALHGKGFICPGKGLYVPGRGKISVTTYPEASDTYKHLMTTLVRGNDMGSTGHDQMKAVCLLTLLRDCYRDLDFRADMYVYRDLANDDLVSSLLENQDHLLDKYNMYTGTLDEIDEALEAMEV